MIKLPKSALASPGKGLHHSLLAACRVGDLQTAQAAVLQLSAALAKATTSAEKTKIALTLSASEPSGWTALLYAARNGWAELAQQLLAAAPSLANPSHAKLASSGNTGEQENSRFQMSHGSSSCIALQHCELCLLHATGTTASSPAVTKHASSCQQYSSSYLLLQSSSLGLDCSEALSAVLAAAHCSVIALMPAAYCHERP